MTILNQSKKDKVSIVSPMRGLAALLVFLFHLVCVSNNYINSELLQSIFKFGKHGVELFFVISGFVISYSLLKSNYRLSYFFRFFQKRLIRIEPPYLLTLSIIILMIMARNVVNSRMLNDELDLIQIALHLGYLIPFSNHEWLSIVFWTLAVEFQFYLIIAILFPFIIESQIMRYLFIIICLTLSFISKSSDHILFWMPIFLSGINLSLLFFHRISKLEFLIVFLIINVFLFQKYETPIFIFSILPQVLIYFFPSTQNRILNFFGEISYSLYLIHTIVAFTIINIGHHLQSTLVVKFIVVMTAIIVTILCSYLFNKYVEKPFKKISANILYK